MDPTPLRFDLPIDTSSRAYKRMARRFALGAKAYGNTLCLLNADGTRTRLGPRPTWKQLVYRSYHRVRMWLT